MCNPMPLRKPPNILRPMKDFDPSEPAILHDRISYTIVAWSGEEAAAFRHPYDLGFAGHPTLSGHAAGQEAAD